MSSARLTQSVAVGAWLEALVVAFVNRELHPAKGASRQAEGEALARSLQALFGIGVPHPLEIGIAGDYFVFSGEPMLAASLQAGPLLHACRAHGVGSLRFLRAASGPEILRLLEFLADAAESAAGDEKALAAGMQRRGLVHATARCAGAAPAAGSPAEAGSIRQYQDLASALVASHVAAVRGQELALDRTQGIVETALKSMDEAPSGLLSLATFEQVDTFTVGHSVRVALLALHVARAAGVDRPALLQVGTAALLHDLGKSQIPQEVLFKKGRLTAEEREVMAQHPRLGAEILMLQKQVDEAAIGAAFCHHMSPTRRGYPKPLLDFEPSGLSKLIRICDVFEAMTAVRPYKRALTPLEAYTLMNQDQAEYDQRWFRFFVRALGLYPQGTRVLLDDGSTAIVTDQGPRPDQPIVRRTTGGEAFVAPLTIGDAGEIRQIRAVVGTGAAMPDDSVLPDPGRCC